MTREEGYFGHVERSWNEIPRPEKKRLSMTDTTLTASIF